MDGPEPSDEALEARWKEGSAPAFAVLFQRWHEKAYGFALRLTNDRHLAEDLAQRAFLNIYKKPPPGTGRAGFKTLLFTVVRNEALNELKRRGRRREGTLEHAPEAADRRDRPDDQAGRDEEARRVRAALAQLPEDERELVLLRGAEGLTFREVCETTGLTRDTVRWRLARGLDRLKRLLEQKTGPGEDRQEEGKQGPSWTATAPTS